MGKLKTADDVTPMQEAFLEELLLDPVNRTSAYERACRRIGHPIPKAVKQIASEMWGKPHVRERWQELVEARRERLEFRADEVLQELRDQLSVDISQVMELKKRWPNDENSVLVLTPIEFSRLSIVQRRAIKSIQRHETEHGINWKIELHDRMHLNELVMEHLGMKKPNLVQNNTQFVINIPAQPSESVDDWVKSFPPSLP